MTCMQLFERAGYVVSASATAAEALDWLEQNEGPCIVLTDVRMPGMDGLELLDAIRARLFPVDVVVMTAYGSIGNAVEAMKRGAADYVTKPFNKDDLLLTIERVRRMRGLQERVDTLEAGLENRYRFEGFLAGSPAMEQVVQRMRSAAESTANMLLTGESGTGKDLVARVIHFSGPRSTAPFVPVNCASLPVELIESELFGHVRGAYTGAVGARAGLVRKAQGGTLFLDEVTEMPPATQATLLRVLEDKRVRPVGGSEEIEVDVRVISATNRDLRGALDEGALRGDLYYRLSVLSIHLPPLRERMEDIAPLLRLFLDRLNRQRPPSELISGIEPDAMEVLLAHSWPGNVRELSNLLERCHALGLTGTLGAADVRRELSIHHEAAGGLGVRGEAGTSVSAGPEAVRPLEEIEREAIDLALRETRNNKAAAARLLGIARKTLYEKIRKYNLEG